MVVGFKMALPGVPRDPPGPPYALLCRREDWNIVGLGQGIEKEDLVRYCIRR